MRHYILEGHNVIDLGEGDDSLFRWARWFEEADRHVARTELPDGLVVSTVFLGIDHSFGRTGPPLLFETMAFHDGDGRETERYATWEQAEKGHAAMVAAFTEVTL